MDAPSSFYDYNFSSLKYHLNIDNIGLLRCLIFIFLIKYLKRVVFSPKILIGFKNYILVGIFLDKKENFAVLFTDKIIPNNRKALKVIKGILDNSLNVYLKIFREELTECLKQCKIMMTETTFINHLVNVVLFEFKSAIVPIHRVLPDLIDMSDINSKHKVINNSFIFISV